MSAMLQRRAEGVVDGKYRLVAELATSKFGAVYEAEDLSVGKRIALKVLRRNLDATARATFFHATRALARLSHPNLVSILALGGDEEHAPYLAMELLTGETAYDLIARDGPMPAAKLTDLALDLFAGLTALHAGGVLHGNLSPRNVFVTYPRPQRPQLKLLGLGVPSVCRNPNPGSGEAAAAEPVTERSDVQAACATLFFLATGRTPATSPALIVQLPDSIRECIAAGLRDGSTASASELLQLLRGAQQAASAPESLPGSVRAGFASLLHHRAFHISRPPKAPLRTPATERLISDSLLLSPRVPKPPGSPRLELGLDFMPSPGQPLARDELEQRRQVTQVPEKNRWFSALSATALGFTLGVVLARWLGLI